jgi:hypothetical protein
MLDNLHRDQPAEATRRECPADNCVRQRWSHRARATLQTSTISALRSRPFAEMPFSQQIEELTAAAADVEHVRLPREVRHVVQPARADIGSDPRKRSSKPTY